MLNIIVLGLLIKRLFRFPEPKDLLAEGHISDLIAFEHIGSPGCGRRLTKGIHLGLRFRERLQEEMKRVGHQRWVGINQEREVCKQEGWDVQEPRSTREPNSLDSTSGSQSRGTARDSRVSGKSPERKLSLWPRTWVLRQKDLF